MPSTSPSTDACPPDESRTTTTSYTVKLTDPDEAARSWRSLIYDAAGQLNCRGVRPNPWPKSEEHDWETAVADYQEARTLREEAVAKMSEVLTRAGIGGFDA